MITTNDPRLTALGLSQYPPLPGSTDPSRIEEIRRTVYISNLEPMVCSRATGNSIFRVPDRFLNAKTEFICKMPFFIGGM